MNKQFQYRFEKYQFLVIFCLTSAVLFIAAVCFYYTTSYYKSKMKYCYIMPMFEPGYTGTDLENIYVYTVSEDPLNTLYGGIHPPGYPIFAIFSLLPFTILPTSILLNAFLIIYLVYTVVFVYYSLYRKFYWVKYSLLPVSLVLVHTSYPIWFLFDRANTEILIFYYMTAFYLLDCHKLTRIGTLPLACGMASKIFPGCLLLVFVRKRDYNSVLISIFLVFSLTFFASLYYGYSIFEPIAQFISVRSKAEYIYGGQTMIFHNTVSSFLRDIGYLMYPEKFIGSDFSKTLVSISTYIGFSLILYSLLVFYYLPLKMWEKYLFIVCLLVVATPESGDYKLVHLMIPLVAFLGQKHSFVRGTTYALIFLILFAFKRMFVIEYEEYPINDPKFFQGMLTMSELINPPLLLFPMFEIPYRAYTRCKYVQKSRTMKNIGKPTPVK